MTASTSLVDGGSGATERAAVVLDGSALSSARATLGSRAAGKSLDAIQALRGFAVLAVVMHHASLMMRTLGLPVPGPSMKRLHLAEVGAAGVDIFFTLSGFLMILIAGPYLERRRSVSNFFLHRLIRIWPLYALATLTLLAKQLYESWRGGWPLSGDFTAHRLAGLAFVPSFNEIGMVRPVFAPGWTLSYEMYFTRASRLRFCSQFIAENCSSVSRRYYSAAWWWASTCRTSRSPRRSCPTRCRWNS